MYGLLGQDNIWLRNIYLKIWNLRVPKIALKVVQIMFSAMHITNQKLSFYIFTVGILQNIFMEHDLYILMIFSIKEKATILIFLAISTNIPLLLMTYLLQIYPCYLLTYGFVIQGYI